MTSNCHCWVCDDRGDLYFLKDINIHHESVISVETIQWTKVDSGFSSIYAGHIGVVCGIKNSSLYLRRGITCQNPMGGGWIQHVCDVVMVMIGKHYIVRKSSRGALHSAKTMHVFNQILDWMFVLPYQEDSETNDVVESCVHHAMDSNDRLYRITGKGEVSYCDLLTSDPHWKLIIGPPHLIRSKGLGGWISNIKFWSSDDDQEWNLSMVSSGLGSVWCHREKSNEVWQLVMGTKTNVNWVKSELPLADKETVVSLSASKTAVDGLYLILREKGYCKLVCFSLNMEDCGEVQIPLPVRYPCNSLAISSINMANTLQNTEDTISAETCKPFGSSLSRKRNISDTNLHPLSKKLKEWRESSSLIDGVGMSFNKHFLTEQFDISPLMSEISSPEEIREKFLYTFSVEHKVVK